VLRYVVAHIKMCIVELVYSDHSWDQCFRPQQMFCNYIIKLCARYAGSRFEWQNQWRLLWQKKKTFLAICVGVSLNLAEMLTT